VMLVVVVCVEISVSKYSFIVDMSVRPHIKWHWWF